MFRVLQEILTQVAPFSLKWTTSFLETALANKSSILQIFLQSKFGINQTTDSKVRAKKLTFCWLKVNFLAITIESVVWLIPDFDCRKICRIDDLFAKAVSRNEVVHLSEKGATWMRISCTYYVCKSLFFSREVSTAYKRSCKQYGCCHFQ